VFSTNSYEQTATLACVGPFAWPSSAGCEVGDTADFTIDQPADVYLSVTGTSPALGSAGGAWGWVAAPSRPDSSQGQITGPSVAGDRIRFGPNATGRAPAHLTAGTYQLGTTLYLTTPPQVGAFASLTVRIDLVPPMPQCPADVGGAGGFAASDGQLDNNDFIAFLSLFFSLNRQADRGSPGGEAWPDGRFDNNDFVAFINQFFTGC
jgi:hypothetical protein